MRVMILALCSIVLSVAAQFLLKAGVSGSAIGPLTADSISARSLLTLATQPALLFGFALYGLGAVVWLLVLHQWDVSKAYPLVGLGFVFTLLIGYLMGDQITPARVAGVLLICSGVFLVGRS
jgi:multidrug transporter EmrE-like cation transporter